MQYYYHSDHLGSASLISDYKGDEYQRIEYTPYGETWVEKTQNTGLEWLPYKFTAKELDEETGLYYYGARYLDPKYSRWISTDSALGEYIPGAGKGNAKESGNLPGMGGLFNTVNGNLYHYAGNNPVKYTDPDGEKTNYSMSESGKSLLKKLEGCVKNAEGLLIAYNDSNNFATKGYGILICKSPLTDVIKESNPPQTETEATADFENKLADFENIVNNRASYTYPNGEQTEDELLLTQPQADAVISLTYNSPKTAKKVMDAIRSGKNNDEIKEIWMDGNDENTGLGKRRAAEWKLYSEGNYEENPYD